VSRRFLFNGKGMAQSKDLAAKDYFDFGAVMQ
jgi:hypothetical protein